ncbi:unnamed protein product [Rodentolepis nana]|uniref:Clathrin assembly protein n=1 Tax=Rodentolepis nana TaxID=102285 RepID=A0A0R3U0G2_RODNA|nr:unnamed protein product [Rodentolepis nana]
MGSPLGLSSEFYVISMRSRKVEVPAFNMMYGAPSVGQAPPMLPTGVYGFPGMNGGGPTPNGVSFRVPPSGAANPTSPTSPTPNAVGSQPIVGQAPYWQATAADPALVAAWKAAASGNLPGGGIRPTVFNPQQQTSGNNGTDTTDSGGGGGGGDLLKLFTNPFADNVTGCARIRIALTISDLAIAVLDRKKCNLVIATAFCCCCASMAQHSLYTSTVPKDACSIPNTLSLVSRAANRTGRGDRIRVTPLSTQIEK